MDREERVREAQSMIQLYIVAECDHLPLQTSSAN